VGKHVGKYVENFFHFSYFTHTIIKNILYNKSKKDRGVIMKKSFSAILVTILACTALVGCSVVPNSSSSDLASSGSSVSPITTESSITESSITEGSSTVSTPTESTPTESTPTESTPTENTPTESTPTVSTPTENTPTEKEDEGYAVTFQCDEHVSVVVYADQEMKSGGEKTNKAVSLDKTTGKATSSGEGQVNFVVVLDDGYSIADIKIEGTYNNLKGAADTGVKNGYRITKIGSALTVTVTSKEDTVEEDLTQGYQVTFTTDEHVKVKVYRTQDMTAEGELTNTAYSRSDSTGALLKDGEGQVNFVLVFDEGYSLDGIAAQGTYKNLKKPADTGVENGYRLTKIGSDVTVTVTSKADTVEEDLTNAFKVTFEVDEHTHVTVYRTQKLTDGEATNVAYARNGDTGDLLVDGEGQVNFAITCDEGYKVSLDSITVTGEHKQVKEVTTGSVYRITKIKGELTVKITASPVSE
jgi:hypothetical protein